MYEKQINEAEAYGVVLYENSSAKSIFDAPSGKVGAKGWAQRIYMILLCIGLFAWFLYSLITVAGEQGVGHAIVSHLLAFFILLMAEAILLLTAFNGWGKFARFALRHNMKRKHGIEGAKTRVLEEELNAADENKSNECAIRIYKDYIIIVNYGEKTLLYISELQSVQCTCVEGIDFKLAFTTQDGTVVEAMRLVPNSDIPRVKKYIPAFENSKAEFQKNYLLRKLPMVAFMLVPILIGVALLILRAFILIGMPIIFGIVFITLGSLMLIAQFSEIAIIGNGIMHILGGLVVMGLPIGIWLTLADLLKFDATSLLLPFTALHAGLSVFLGFGPLLIIAGVVGFIDSLKAKK